MNDTIDALEALKRSEGWRLLTLAARQEWTVRERDGVKAVVSHDDQSAINKLRQIVAAREAVEWVLALPDQELSRLRRIETSQTSPSGTGRQPPPEIVAQMSRRGSL